MVNLFFYAKYNHRGRTEGIEVGVINETGKVLIKNTDLFLKRLGLRTKSENEKGFSYCEYKKHKFDSIKPGKYARNHKVLTITQALKPLVEARVSK